MGVLLVDLDDTLVPDAGARDQAMTLTLSTFGALLDLSAVWPVVREEWRVSGLRELSALAGVSSWEALWTDFDIALDEPAAQVAGRAYQERVWRRLLPSRDPAAAGVAFCRAREELVRAFSWVPDSLAAWGSVHELWCVTNGSSWLQRRKLRLAGLDPSFHQLVVSGEVGAVKSDVRFGETLAARLAEVGSTPVAVIGDSNTSDGTLASFLGVPHFPVSPGTRPQDDAIQRV